MSPCKYSVCFIIIVIVLGTTEGNKIERPKIENIHRVINMWNEVPHETIKTESNNNCPPPSGQGILQVKSGKLDISLTNENQNAIDSLRFTCGYTQIMKKVPISWAMQTQDDGLQKNVTFYTTTLEHVPVCCPGYVRDHNDICIPKCKGGCKDGVCLSPANCACYQGYGENNEGECVLTCPCKCPHGKCSGDTCICDAGYALDPLSQTCNPVCKDGCVNAECTSPGVCTCLPGYKKTGTDYICSPDCGTGCTHGKCIGPHTCECNEGYQNSDSDTCVPRCAGCEHGDCVHPSQCRCHDGYTRIGEECQTLCDFQCHNATCTAPNTCTCISGFVKVSPSACVPECNPECKNADCVAPNQCQCHKNYKKSALRRHICVLYPYVPQSYTL